MSKYLVKLTPYDKFFFGGETTFGEGENTNYFVKSNYFPQQTGLLGLVRFQLLLQSNNGIFVNNKIQKTKEATELIGIKSFEIYDHKFSFGKIVGLSPVFISDRNNNFLFPANREYQWIEEEDEKKINNFIFREFDQKEGTISISSRKNFIAFLSKYNAKEGLPDLLVNKNLSIKKFYGYEPEKVKDNKPENGIFIEDEQTGIRKNYEGNTDEKAFYIQSFYKLDKNYSFAFILELEDNANFTTRDLVILGGEQSKFRMEVENFDDSFEDIKPEYQVSAKSDKVVLVSDAFCTNEIFNDCPFAVTETIDFRSIKSSVKETSDYSALDRSKKIIEQLCKTAKYNIFKKGSVFYGEPSKITAHFDKNNALKKIGYNHYKIVKKQEEKS